MPRVGLVVAAVIMVIALLSGLAGSPVPAEGAGKPYIVVLHRDVVAASRVATTAADLGREHGITIDHVYQVVLRGFAARLSPSKLARLSRDPRVASIGLDRKVHAFAETLPTGVDRVGGDSTTEGAPPTQAGEAVAVIDTGIARHSDLNIAGGHNCAPGKRRDWQDGNGHGTHVAGIIGAKNNGRGVVGVAPGTPLYAVRVLDDFGSGRISWLICGLDWAAANGINVANMSLGGRFPGEDRDICDSSPLHIAICDAANLGMKIVVAAGNAGEDAGDYFPAKYDQVTTVSALADSDGCAGRQGDPTLDGADDTLATFSNDGDVVDVAAPGVGILSTWPNGRFARLTGTSMAAPHVTGAVALGWPGTEEPGAIPGDDDGVDEGTLSLSGNTAC